MGQIVGGAAKPKRCNLNKLSQLGIPAAGEHILVSSDNSMNAAGQGNFDAYVVGDGNTVATALPLMEVTGGISQLEAKVDEVAIRFREGQYVLLSALVYEIGDTIDLTNIKNNASYKYAILDVTEGDIITLNGTSAGSARTWAYLDSANKLLDWAGTSGTVTNLKKVIPAGVAKVIINTQPEKQCYYQSVSALTPRFVTLENLDEVNGAALGRQMVTSLSASDFSIIADTRARMVIELGGRQFSGTFTPNAAIYVGVSLYDEGMAVLYNSGWSSSPITINTEDYPSAVSVRFEVTLRTFQSITPEVAAENATVNYTLIYSLTGAAADINSLKISNHAEEDALQYEHITKWEESDLVAFSATRIRKKIILNGRRIYGSLTVNSSFKLTVQILDKTGATLSDTGWVNTCNFDSANIEGAHSIFMQFVNSSFTDVTISELLVGITKLDYTIIMPAGSAIVGLKDKLIGNGNSSYYGDRITINVMEREYDCTLTYLFQEVFGSGNPLTNAQSMVIYNGKMFVFLDNTSDAGNTGFVYDIETMSLLSNFVLPERNHNNNAQFSDIFYDADDDYPLLMLSKGDYDSADNGFRMVRVVEENGTFTFTTIKTIHCSVANASYNGSWVADFKQKRLWLYTYTRAPYAETENNFMCLIEFAFPVLSGTGDITLTDSDVIRQIVLPYGVMQAATVIGGDIWLQAQQMTEVNGVPADLNQKHILVIDTGTGRIKSVIVSDQYENEGIDLYNGEVYCISKLGTASTSTTVCFKAFKFTF